MEIDAAIHKKISDATYIDDETISRVDKDKSIMKLPGPLVEPDS